MVNSLALKYIWVLWLAWTLVPSLMTRAEKLPFKMALASCLASQGRYSPICVSPGASGLSVELQERFCRICTENLLLHQVMFCILHMSI